jgi:hypothetical protein
MHDPLILFWDEPSTGLDEIDTVLKYETLEGDIKYSDILEVPVKVKESGFFQRLFGWI